MEHIPIDEETKRSYGRKRRNRLVLMIIPGGIGIITLSFVFSSIFDYFFALVRFDPSIIVLLSFVFIVLSLSVILLTYLQSGFKYFKSPKTNSYTYESEKDTFKKEVRSEIDQWISNSDQTERLTELEERLGEINLRSINLADEERKNILSQLQEDLKQSAKEDFLEEIRVSIEKNQTVPQLKKELEEQYKTTIYRLTLELSALSRRGNLNLILGILTAVAGISLLGYFVYKLPMPTPGENFLTFTAYFIPRVSVVLLVEIFSYFFLRLYSTSLIEIKYFQNEITNLEAKFLALRTALHSKKENLVGNVIDELARTERNAIIRKGETTAAIERSRAEKDSVASISKTLTKAIHRKPQ